MSGFYIIKNNATGLVLEGGNPCHGNHVVLSPKHGGPNQQWRDDPCTGTIRCKQNDLCMDIECDHLVLHPHQHGKQSQQWERKCDVIASRCDCNTVLAVAGCGQKIVKVAKHCAGNHTWTFEFCHC